MKKLLRSLIFIAAAVGLRGAPNDVIITQQNATTGTAQIQTIVPASKNQLLGTNGAGKVATVGSTGDIILSILDYGAVADGQTDIAPAVTAAIAACPAGGTVYFPAGALGYMWKAQVVCAKSNITFLGFGTNILTDAPPDARKLSFTGQSNIVVSGLNFDGDFPTGTGFGNGYGFLELTNCNDVVVKDCGFANTQYDGIFGQGSCTRCSIFNNRFSFYFGGVIFYSTGSAGQFQAIDVSANRFLPGNVSTGTTGSGSIKLIGLGTASGVVNYNLQGQYNIARNSISNTGGQMGIECNGSVNHATVVGNTIYGTGFGISIANSAHCAINGNTIKNFASYGIEVAAGCQDTSATGNTIDGTNTSGTGTPAYCYSVINSIDTTITGGSASGANCGVYAQDVGGGVGPVINLTVTGVTFFNPANNVSIIYIKDIAGFTLDGCTLVGTTSTSAYLTFDQIDGPNSNIQILNNKFLGVTSAQAVSLVNTSSNAISHVTITGNDSSGVTSIPSGWWNVPGLNQANMKWFRVYGNTDGGSVGNDQAFQSAYSTYAGNQTLTTYFYMLAEGALNSVDATTGSCTFLLPDCTTQSGNGWEATFQKADSTGNTVTLTTSGGQTINGATTYVLSNQFSQVRVRSNGSNWVVVGIPDWGAPGPIGVTFPNSGTFTQVYALAPNSGTSGAVVIKDAASNSGVGYLQWVNNADASEYGDMRFTTTGLFTKTGGSQSVVVAVTESANAATFNAAQGDYFGCALNGNLTSVSLLNFGSGQTMVIALTNTASNYTVTWGNSIHWVGGSQPVQTVGAHTDIWTLVNIGGSIYGSVVQNF